MGKEFDCNAYTFFKYKAGLIDLLTSMLQVTMGEKIKRRSDQGDKKGTNLWNQAGKVCNFPYWR